MPHIDVEWFKGRDEETKKKVAEALVETMIRETGCQRSHLSVAFHDHDPADWNAEVRDKVDPEAVVLGEVYTVE